MRVKVVVLLLLSILSFAFAQNNTVDCSTFADCDTCTDHSSCVWCEEDVECQQGGFMGPSTFFPSCSDWKWKQCYINGRYYTWYPIFVIIFILLIVCVCALITCLFCNPILYFYNKLKKKGDYVRWEKLQQEMENQTREPTESEIRRDSLRSKYNIK